LFLEGPLNSLWWGIRSIVLPAIFCAVVFTIVAGLAGLIVLFYRISSRARRMWATFRVWLDAALRRHNTEMGSALLSLLGVVGVISLVATCIIYGDLISAVL